MIASFVNSGRSNSLRAWRLFVYRAGQVFPICAGVIVCLIYFYYGVNIAKWSKQNDLHLENCYAPVAGIFAIVAGFLASFYGSIQSIADTRLRRIAKSATFNRFIYRIKEATIAGFALAVISLPYMVVTPIGERSSTARFFIAVWLGASIYAFATFVRVGRLLFFVFEHQPPEDQGAG
jgi:hypothetical protein